MSWMSCSERDVSGFGNRIGNSKGHFMIASGLWAGRARRDSNPNLLIRSKIRFVQILPWSSIRPASTFHGDVRVPASSCPCSSRFVVSNCVSKIGVAWD